jgi:hypothetical protein
MPGGAAFAIAQLDRFRSATSLGYTCTEHASTDRATHIVLAK